MFKSIVFNFLDFIFGATFSVKLFSFDWPVNEVLFILFSKLLFFNFSCNLLLIKSFTESYFFFIVLLSIISLGLSLVYSGFWFLLLINKLFNLSPCLLSIFCLFWDKSFFFLASSSHLSIFVFICFILSIIVWFFFF